MRPYLGLPLIDSRQICAVNVFHHAPPMHGIQNAEMQKKKKKKKKKRFFVTSSLRYSIALMPLKSTGSRTSVVLPRLQRDPGTKVVIRMAYYYYFVCLMQQYEKDFSIINQLRCNQMKFIFSFTFLKHSETYILVAHFCLYSFILGVLRTSTSLATQRILGSCSVKSNR